MSTNATTSPSTAQPSKSLSVFKTYTISRRGRVSARHLKIDHGNDTLFNVHVGSSDNPTITLQNPNGTDDVDVATVKLSRHSHDMELVKLSRHNHDMTMLEGNLDGHTGVTFHGGEGGTMDPYYTFKASETWYAWHSTCFNVVHVRTSDGVEDKTYGSRDWRLVKLSTETQMPSRDAAVVVAVYIEQEESWKRPQAARVHWIEGMDGVVEAASLAVLMGILDRKRRSGKEYRSGTALLYS